VKSYKELLESQLKFLPPNEALTTTDFNEFVETPRTSKPKV
jgi:hypothetical protein